MSDAVTCQVVLSDAVTCQVVLSESSDMSGCVARKQ